MAGSFDVLYTDVQNMQNDYATIRGEIDDMIQDLSLDVQGVTGLASFSGSAATKAKTYYQEVHQTYLLPALSALMGQLATDYALYYERFMNDPINESVDNARWPHDAMTSYVSDLKGAQSAHLESAETQLAKATSILSGLGSYSIPSSSSVRELVSSEVDLTNKTDEGVAENEQYGVSLFTDAGGEFETLAVALSNAMGACTNGVVGMAGYQSGAFSSVLDSSGLREAYNASVVNQTENAEVTVQSQQDSITQAQTRIEREAKEAAEQKAWWNVLGTIGSVLTIAGAAVATVATGGASTPLLVLAVAGLTATTVNELSSIGGRMRENAAIRNGNYYTGDNEVLAWGTGEEGQERVDKIQDAQGYLSDVGDSLSDLDEATDFIDKQGNTIGKRTAEYFGDRADLSLDKGFVNVMNTGTDMLIDQMKDAYADSPEDELIVDGAKFAKNQTLDYVTDHMIPGNKVNPGSVIGAAGEATSIFADYKCDKCDEVLNDCLERTNQLESLRENAGNYTGPMW